MCPRPARFLYLLYPLLVLWRGSEATTSSSLECSLPGLCQGVLLEQSSSTSLDNCILFGRSTPGATWVTFNRGLGYCSALQACDHLDASVPDRVSSDVNCTLCSVTGACKGVLLIDYSAESAEDCLGLCRAEEGCAWYSFNDDLLFCDLFQSCSDLLVAGHENWVSGEVACFTPAPAEDQEIVWINDADGAVRLGKFSKQIFNVIRFVFVNYGISVNTTMI